MKTLVCSLLVVIFSLGAIDAGHARNVKQNLHIATATHSADSPDKPTGSLKLFFGSQPTPKILSHSASYVANARTSALSKSDLQARNDAFLWTLVALE